MVWSPIIVWTLIVLYSDVRHYEAVAGQCSIPLPNLTLAIEQTWNKHVRARYNRHVRLPIPRI